MRPPPPAVVDPMPGAQAAVRHRRQRVPQAAAGGVPAADQGWDQVATPRRAPQHLGALSATPQAPLTDFPAPEHGESAAPSQRDGRTPATAYFPNIPLCISFLGGCSGNTLPRLPAGSPCGQHPDSGTGRHRRGRHRWRRTAPGPVQPCEKAPQAECPPSAPYA